MENFLTQEQQQEEQQCEEEEAATYNLVLAAKMTRRLSVRQILLSFFLSKFSYTVWAYFSFSPIMMFCTAADALIFVYQFSGNTCFIKAK